MKKSKLNMRFMLILFALVPFIIGILCSVYMASIEVNTNLKRSKEETIRSAVDGLKIYCEEEYANIGAINYNTSYVDALEKEGVYLTVFLGKTRFITSIKDETGKRIEGTDASDEVVATVLNGKKDFSSDDVVINGEEYYVYYEPILDPSGNAIGMAFAGMPRSSVTEAVNGIIKQIIFVVFVLSIIIIVVVIIIAKKVAAPIKTVADSISTIAEGNISEPTDASSRILEIQNLVLASSKLQTTLSDIIGKTKNISSELGVDAESVSTLSSRSSDGATQIAQAMEDLAQGATGLAENVQNINEQTIELGFAIEGITNNASSLIESSNNIRVANKEASDCIAMVSRSSDESVNAVNDISAQINATNEAIDRIKSAVEMISNIASQTNLLALNASIEAARAGDAGRGFAVVATEIGSLSEQSNSSAQEIKALVNEIVEKSEQSVALSQQVAKIISDEQTFIDTTQDKFTVLNNEIQMSIDGINSISQKIESLEGVKNVIMGAVSDLSAISEENAASNQEVSASISGIVEAITEIARSSDGTSSRAQTLNETVDYFR